MRRPGSFITYSWGLVWLLTGACARPHPAELVIRSVTVVDVTDGALISDQTVVVEGNRITWI